MLSDGGLILRDGGVVLCDGLNRVCERGIEGEEVFLNGGLEACGMS